MAINDPVHQLHARGKDGKLRVVGQKEVVVDECLHGGMLAPLLA